MVRLVVPAGLILLGVALLLFAGDVLQPGSGPGHEDDPLAALEAQMAEDAAEDPQDGPSLAAAPGREAGMAAAGSDGDPAAEARGPTGPYEITVIDADTFAPLDGVEIQDPDGGPLGATDERGGWRLEDAGVDRLGFRALHPGYVLHTGVAKPGEPLEVHLYAGISLKALLVRGSGDTPVAHATVRGWDEDLGREVIATGTDAEGRFHLRSVRPHHPYVFVVTVAGRAPVRHRARFEAAPAEPWVLRVPAGNKVEGQVIDAAGKPAAGMEVWLMPPVRRPLDERIARARAAEREQLMARDLGVAETAVTRTNEHGRYVFEGVQGGGRAWVPLAWAGPRHLVRGKVVRFPGDDASAEVDIHIRPAGTLRVSVRDDKGTPLPQVALDLRGPEGAIRPTPQDRWEGGTVTFEGLTPGAYQAQARLPGRAPKTRGLRVDAGGTSRIDLVFEVGQTLTGVVVDRAGEPIWNASVQWRGADRRESATASTDDGGRFRLTGLLSSSATMVVSARELPHTRKTYETLVEQGVTPADSPVRFVLPDGPAVIGRFPDLPAGSRLVCRMLAGDEVSDWPLVLDAEGGFRRDGPDAEHTATFVFRMRGKTPLVVRSPGRFESGEVRDLGSLAFTETNPRRGKVLGPDGRPVHGAKITVATPWSGRSTRTDTEGDFVLARLPDERLPIRIEADDLPVVRATLEPQSQFRRQVFRLQPGRRVLVSLLGYRPHPGRRGRIIARLKPTPGVPQDMVPPPQERTPGAEGHAAFWLPIGAYVFEVAFQDETGAWIQTEATAVVGPVKDPKTAKPQQVEIPLPKGRR